MKVGLISGGTSVERPGSLRSAAAVAPALRELGYTVVDIDPIDKYFYQHLIGLDVAFNCLHGGFGEDGSIQGLLECLKIPYTGCGILPSAVTMHKVVLKKLLIALGIQTPPYIFATVDTIDTLPARVSANLNYPVVVKPVSEGGSYGLSYVATQDEILEAVNEAAFYGDILVEEYISGENISITAMEWSGHVKCLPILKIILPDGHLVYSEEVKHTSGAAVYECPAEIDASVAGAMISVVELLYRELKCTGFVRVDLIRSGRRFYVLEVNTSPGLSLQGNLAAMAAADGMSYTQLIAHIMSSRGLKS